MLMYIGVRERGVILYKKCDTFTRGENKRVAIQLETQGGGGGVGSSTF